MVPNPQQAHYRLYIICAAIAKDQILVTSFQMIVKILLNGEIPVTSCIEPGKHDADVIISTVASQNTSLTIVYSIFHSDADHRKHQSSASLAFVAFHRWPVNSPHKWPVMFSLDDVILVTF